MDKFRLTGLKLVEGRFIKRLNRFVVKCEIKNKIHLAHLPNPGRLWELLFEGSKILLYHNKKETRNLEYTVAAVYKNSKPVLLHTSKTNDVAEWLLKNNLIPELKDYQLIQREKTIHKSRIDFFLSNGKQNLFLEVKSCTLFHHKLAMFPDAITERGSKHLVELAELNNKNTKGGILFLVHSANVDYFLPEFHTDLKFTQNFLNNYARLIYLAYGLNWNDDLTLQRENIKRIQIPLDVLRKETHDSGTYLLLIHNNENQKIEIGNLGKINFPKGHYCYIGSGMMNLSKRVERHKRKTKKLHWHIDYILQKMKIHKTIEIRSTDRLECDVAERLKQISNKEVKNFGSSDCSCSSHLLYFEKNPLQIKEFIDMILFYRMERLIQKYKL